MSMEDYIAARKEGIKQLHALESRGQDPYLPVLAELVPKLNQMAQVPLGLVQIGLDQIEGTATKGRTTAFARGFLPLLDRIPNLRPNGASFTTALWKTVCVSPSSRWNITTASTSSRATNA